MPPMPAPDHPAVTVQAGHRPSPAAGRRPRPRPGEPGTMLTRARAPRQDTGPQQPRSGCPRCADGGLAG
jgi:hypothetical protein